MERAMKDDAPRYVKAEPGNPEIERERGFLQALVYSSRVTWLLLSSNQTKSRCTEAAASVKRAHHKMLRITYEWAKGDVLGALCDRMMPFRWTAEGLWDRDVWVSWKETAILLLEVELEVRECAAGMSEFPLTPVTGEYRSRARPHGSLLRFPSNHPEHSGPAGHVHAGGESLTGRVLSNGHRIPVLGFGTTDVDRVGTTQGEVNTALGSGYRMIDLANAYKNEWVVPAALYHAKLDRGSLFIATKVDSRLDQEFNQDDSYYRAGPEADKPEEEEDDEGEEEEEEKEERKSVNATLPRQLARLRTDYIDLLMLQQGCPGLDQPCWERYLKEYAEMDRRVGLGQVRSLAVSGPISVGQLQELHRNVSIRPVVLQLKHSVYHAGHPCSAVHHQDLLQLAWDLNMTVTAHGSLSTHPNDIPPVHDPIVHHIARRYRIGPAQVLLRHAVQLGLTVLTRSTKRKRIVQNRRIDHFRLEPAAMRILNGLAWLMQICGAPRNDDPLGVRAMLGDLECGLCEAPRAYAP